EPFVLLAGCESNAHSNPCKEPPSEKDIRRTGRWRTRSMSLRARIRPLPLIAALAVALLLPAGASAASYGSRTLRVGAHGKDVKRLQAYLGSAGHRVLRDGEFGPRTRRALLATERELELRADGVATRREQRAIRRAVRAASTGGAAYVAPP